MTWHPIPISGRFLSLACGFAGVSGIATNINEYRDFVGEEPVRFPYPLTRIVILSPNVLKCSETPAAVGFHDRFLKIDYRIKIQIDLTNGMEMD
jgi:hypothetical protein